MCYILKLLITTNFLRNHFLLVLEWGPCRSLRKACHVSDAWREKMHPELTDLIKH